MARSAASAAIEAAKSRKGADEKSKSTAPRSAASTPSTAGTAGSKMGSVHSTVKVEKVGGVTKTTKVNTSNKQVTSNTLPPDFTKQFGGASGFDLAMLQQQMKAASSAPGMKGKRPVFVVICNETKVKKRRLRKKDKKKKAAGSGKGGAGGAEAGSTNPKGKPKDKDDDDDDSGSDRRNAKELPDAEHAHDGYDNLEPLQEGAVVPGAIAAKGPVGVVIVPIDKKAENEKAPFANAPDKAIHGYLRKSPDGTPVFIPEDKMPKGKDGKVEKQQNCYPGYLIKGPHNEALFVPDGVNVDKETGIPIREKIIGPDGKEIKIDDVGADTPITGYIKLKKDGMPVFVKKEIDMDDSKVQIQEKLPPRACTGVLVKDNKGCTTFVSTDPNGVGAVKKEDSKTKQDKTNEEVKMLPPVGSVTAAVVNDENGVPKTVPYDPANPDKSVKPNGFIVQAANGPVFIPAKKMEEHGKKAHEDMKTGPLVAQEPIAADPEAAGGRSIEGGHPSAGASASGTGAGGGGSAAAAGAAGGAAAAGGRKTSTERTTEGAAGAPIRPSASSRQDAPQQQEVQSVALGVPGALHSFMAASKSNQQNVTLANQVSRAKDENRTLKDVQKEDFEKEQEIKQMAEERRQMFEEHRKYLEARSVAIDPVLMAYRQ